MTHDENATPSGPDRKLSRREAAEYCGLQRNTLARMAVAGKGPPYIKISSRCVRYSQRALDQWLAERTKTPVGSAA